MERERLSKKELAISGAIWTIFAVGTIVAALKCGVKEAQDNYPQDSYPYQPRNERIIPPPKHTGAILGEEFSPQKLKEDEEQTPSPINTSIIVQGPATYYGVTDGYGPEDSLGCTGDSFDPYNEETAARPENSPFQCGDKVEVCDTDSCIDVYIKDTCPGCDDYGIVIDLSYGAMQKLSPGSGRTEVTLEGPK